MDNRDLFKFIISAYKDGIFEEKVNSLLEESTDNKIYTANVIAALCGVSLDYNSESFTSDLKKAVENYSTDTKVVTRVKECTMNCIINDGKTQCQAACPFDAIKVDCINHTTYIDDKKCTDCGFCVEACPNNNYMDKSEVLPLLEALR